MEKNKIKVTNNLGDKLYLELAWDADLETYLDSFKAILKWLTFPDVLVSSIKIEDNDKN